MGKETSQELKSKEPRFPLGIGKEYSRSDLLSFIEETERVEGSRQAHVYERSILIGLAIPPVLSPFILALPKPEAQLPGFLEGLVLAATAIEAMWVLPNLAKAFWQEVVKKQALT